VERSTGFSLAEILGKNPGDLWGGHMNKAFYERLWHTIKQKKKPFSSEVRNTTKSGQEIWQELRISPVKDRKGRVQYFIGIEPHIDSRKREEEFREEFLSVIGHESLTPVTAMRWLLEMLLQRKRLTASQRATLHTVYSQNKRLEGMLRDLVALSRHGKGHPARTRFVLAQALAPVLHAFAEDLPNVTIHLSEPEPHCTITGYPSLVLTLCTGLLRAAAGELGIHGGVILAQLGHKKDTCRFSCSILTKRKHSATSDLTLPSLIAHYAHLKPPMRRTRGHRTTWSIELRSAS
jgi:PAS domain S-box-containing protein